MMKKFCPNCGGTDLDLEAGGIGGMMECKDCGYTGVFFPEKEKQKSEEDEELIPIIRGKSFSEGKSILKVKKIKKAGKKK